MFIRKVGIDRWIDSVRGKICDKLGEDERIISLGC
jgi:hypothetical protein